jgi:hypothetical protein
VAPTTTKDAIFTLPTGVLVCKAPLEAGSRTLLEHCDLAAVSEYRSNLLLPGTCLRVACCQLTCVVTSRFGE